MRKQTFYVPTVSASRFPAWVVVALGVTFVQAIFSFLFVFSPASLSVETMLGVWTCATICIIAAGISSFDRGLLHLITAKTAVLVGSFVFLVGGAFSTLAWTKRYLDVGRDAVVEVCGMCTLGLVAFLLGYSRDTSKVSLRFVKHLSARLSSRRIWTIATVFGAAGLVGYLNQPLFELTSSEFKNPWEHLIELWVVVAGILLIRVLRAECSLIERMLALAVVIPILAFYVTGWSRRPAQTVLITGVAYFAATRRVPVRTQLRVAAIIAVIGVGATVIQGAWRGLSETDKAQVDVRTLVASGMLSPSLYNIDTVDVALEVVEVFPRQAEYLHGKSFFALLVNPIPRVYWPEKPVGFGYTIAQLMAGHRGASYNLGASIYAELYANGGMWLVPCGMFLLGWFCKIYDKSLLASVDSEAAILIHSVGLYQLFFLVRGDFLDAGYQLLISVVPLLFIFGFAGAGRARVLAPASAPAPAPPPPRLVGRVAVR